MHSLFIHRCIIIVLFYYKSGPVVPSTKLRPRCDFFPSNAPRFECEITTVFACLQKKNSRGTFKNAIPVFDGHDMS